MEKRETSISAGSIYREKGPVPYNEKRDTVQEKERKKDASPLPIQSISSLTRADLSAADDFSH